MSFQKVLVLCLLGASMVLGAPTQQAARLVQPAILRTIPHAQIIAQPAIRTVLAQPAAVHQVHTVQAAPVVQAVRTVEAAPVVHAVRTVEAAPVVQAVRTVAASPYEQVEEVQEEVIDENPQYSFGYSVADARSGDSKTREETRDGDYVSGSYSVADPDGRVRRVEYTADGKNGFQATVTYDGEPGPVAIPFDAPATVAVASPEPAAAAVAVDDDINVIDVRANAANNNAGTSSNTGYNNVQTVRTIQAVQADATHVLHAAPALRTEATHVLHAAPAVRTEATHVLHAAPAVRTDATHVLHAAPTVVQHVAQTPVIQRFASHGVVAAPVVQRVASTPVVHQVATPATQVRFVNAAALPAGTRLIHV